MNKVLSDERFGAKLRVTENRCCETKLQSLKSLKNNEDLRLIKSETIKSCSFHPLIVSMMAKCCHAFLPIRRRIINLSLATGEMPEDLKWAMP